MVMKSAQLKQQRRVQGHIVYALKRLIKHEYSSFSENINYYFLIIQL